MSIRILNATTAVSSPNYFYNSINMLAPRGAAYSEYAALRQSITPPESRLLPINPIVDPGRPLGLHPALGGLQTLFENGKLAFVANVGTLVDTGTTKVNYHAGPSLPLGLFSHSDPIEQWQTSIPDNPSGIDWGGRMADLLKSLNAEDRFSINISLDGSNV